MAIIPFDPSKRKSQRAKAASGARGKVISLAHLSPRVQLKQLQRQADRELAYLNYLLLLTRGEPEMLPSLEQMQEIVDGTIEF